MTQPKRKVRAIPEYQPNPDLRKLARALIDLVLDQQDKEQKGSQYLPDAPAVSPPSEAA